MDSVRSPLLEASGNTYGSAESQMNEEETSSIGQDYAVIEFPTDMHDTTGVLLEKCQRFVLRPYNLFLCVIGWRKVNVAVMYERACDFFSLLWPFTVFVILLASCGIQILLCFTRDSIPMQQQPHNSSRLVIRCSHHIVSSYVILNVLLIATYLYGLFIFRFQQPEDLSGMTQKVFCAIEEKKSKKLAVSMLFLLLLGFAWILYSFGVSITRIFAHGLNKDVGLEFFESYDNQSIVVKVTLLTIAQFGFIVFDIAYAAVIMNYAMQCQLIVYSLDNINTRVMSKAWTIDEAIREINIVRYCLAKINGHLSRATGAIMFIFLYSSVSSLYSLQQLLPTSDDIVLSAITCVLSAVQWTIWLLMPLVQAARVTHAGSKLRETALEIRSRPFQYKDTSQIDLDSLVTYCCNVQMKAKLLSVSISPQLVVGGGFFLGFTLYMVLKFDNYSWASWL